MNRNTDGRLTFTVLSISLLTVMAGAAIDPALGVIRGHYSTAADMLVLLAPFKVGVFIGVIYLLQAFMTRNKQVVE